jgi:inorganic pyrophosphatase/exopolyphosphatase
MMMVTGNEAGDADTIVSAICLSYLRHHQTRGTSGASTVAPVLPFPQEDLSLRTETCALLKMCGLDSR